MLEQRHVVVSVELPKQWVRHLQALVEPPGRLHDVAAAQVELADHAQQGVCRPGGWGRDRLRQTFGNGWLVRFGPDLEAVVIIERPRRGDS